ncbi:MAG: NUDIX domain-containing protein [Candidatus Diapherotrites archaeon]|nr:NUDIX domain-containing protein [Candidatus Diapherotrites archaeon]
MEEKSCGTVVYNPKIQKFLLLRYSKHWGFPKGNQEPGETEEQTALRELEEETGIHAERVEPNFRKEIEYFYVRAGKRIHKTVVFFLVKTEKTDVKVSWEHKGYKWLSYDDAMKHLTFNTAKEVLKEAKAFLDQRTLVFYT